MRIPRLNGLEHLGYSTRLERGRERSVEEDGDVSRVFGGYEGEEVVYDTGAGVL